MEYTLNMIFLTAGGKKVTFSVTDAQSNITGAIAKTLMDAILAENIFTTSSGDLVSKSSASLIGKTVTTLDVEL